MDNVTSPTSDFAHSTTVFNSSTNATVEFVNSSTLLSSAKPNFAAASESISKDDAAWILTNSFLILTMQSGFGLLEAGCVSSKNIANIMVKNVVDVTLGGITYWMVGYGLAFGEPSNAFCGFGSFFMSSSEADGDMGSKYSHYVFQFSFATAATTIVSGAVAERMKLAAYMVFSMINTFVYCFPSSWAWNSPGFGNMVTRVRHLATSTSKPYYLLHPFSFLAQRGFFDFAGACVVHLTGGASALVASIMLGPRLGRFGANDNYGMSSPVTALTGTFMLWWAWLGFNCGSTFGISDPSWKVAAKVGVNTLNGSIGGGIAGILISMVVSYKSIYFDIGYIITSILGGLVGVTACCAVVTPTESILIGAIGAWVAIGVTHLLEKMRVDDPVGAFPVHFGAAVWGTLAVGLFGQNEFDQLGGRSGLFHGGGFRQTAEQALGILVMTVWSMACTAITFFFLAKTMGIRMAPEEEILGADWVEHKVRSENFAIKMEKALENMNASDAAMEDLVSKVLAQINKSRENESNQRPSVKSAGKVKVLDAEGLQAMLGEGSGMRGIPYNKGPELVHLEPQAQTSEQSRPSSVSQRRLVRPDDSYDVPGGISEAARSQVTTML